MSRRFITKADSMAEHGICDAATIGRWKRSQEMRPHVPSGILPAIRVRGQVFEAESGERLHCQMFLRLLGSPLTAEDLAALRNHEHEDGFTVPDVPSPPLGENPPPKGEADAT